ncbi:MAG: 50S ribosomal protein L18P [Candidatus Heimdallarchaeota archaeon AB_125]|nr:MAG: 50S ribosomal protein L18P [Candidatus Heimdallarchaeota archaeon AB_125]
MSRRSKKGFKKRRKLQPKRIRYGPLYRVPFRRRREMKTDYGQRKRLLKSGKIRFVARPSNKQVLVQFIESKIGGDQTFVQVRSNELKKHGWDVATSNLPAAYLTGYLAGKKALKSKIKEAILDVGTFAVNPGTRLFATLKGVVDAGVEIPFNEKMIPSEKRLRGEHIKSYATLLAKEDKEKYSKVFSKYLEVNKKPENLPTLFDEVKAKIDTL